MRAVLRFLVLLCVVMVACVGFSRAQVGADGVKSQSLSFQRVGGMTGADSVGRMLKMDASGNAKVVDADRDRDLVLGQNSIIGATIAACSAESSLAFPVGNARHITLWLDTKNTAASGDARLAVQFRIHLTSSSDSNSVAVWSPNTSFGFGSSSKPDSVGDLMAMPTTCGAANTDEILMRWVVAHWTGVAGQTNSYLAPRMKMMTFEVAPGTGTYFSVRVRNVGVGSQKVVVHYRASAL